MSVCTTTSSSWAGGHSLLGAELIAKVKQTFGVELALIDLFEQGTIAAMADHIERLSAPKAA